VLLRASEGKTFADRRDAALIRLLLDSGARRSEIAGLTVDAAGRGRSPSAPGLRSQSIAISASGGSTATLSDPSCGSVDGGKVTTDGIADILERRCLMAGLARIGAHAFRHLFAH
jgi:site-specific recombinase XerD